MLAVAVGIVAALLIAVSRRRELTVSIEQALVAPMAVCSVGAAVVNLWAAFALSGLWTPASIVTLLVAAFQAEWAFAVTRRQLRSALLAAGLIVNAAAFVVLVWSRVTAATVGAAPGFGIAGTDLAVLAFEGALVAMLVPAVWPSTRHLLSTRRIAATTAIEIRSVAVSLVGLLTFLALAGGGGHSDVAPAPAGSRRRDADHLPCCHAVELRRLAVGPVDADRVGDRRRPKPEVGLARRSGEVAAAGKDDL
jgi:hypothetical protein